MASPAPEAAAPADPQPLDAAPIKDVKSDMNGQSSPSEPAPESKPESDKPTTNGDAKSEEHAPTNGDAKEDVPMGDSNAAPTESAPPKADEPVASAAPAEKSPETAAPAPIQPTEVESPKDVEMGDSKPAEDSSAAAPESEPKPAEETVETVETVAVPENAAPNDVAQEDVKKSATPAEAPEKETEASVKTEETSLLNEDSTLPTSEVDLGPSGISQLAIETTEGNGSPVEASVEVSMTDAPGAKVPREREDDATDEPAPKRARTEPKEDEPSTEGPAPAAASTETPAEPAAAAAAEPASAAPAGPPLEPSTRAETELRLAELPKWTDSAFNAKVIKPFQRRDLRKSMGRVKKTKNGAHFRDSVQRLWPALWDKYSASVTKPMDLGEIDRNLRDEIYKTFGDMKTDLILIAENSLSFNGPAHDMTVASVAAISSVWDDVMAIPEEEPVKQKPPPKAGSRIRESRSAFPKPEGDGAQAAQASPAAAPKSAPASDARRASAVADVDRPKRTVRAPKSKDIDYSTKPSRKKLKPELQFCDDVLAEVMHTKHFNLNQWFNDPVDAEGLGIPHYYSTIKQPMDFGKIYKMLHEGEIASFKDFDKLVKLVFNNCYQFNGQPDQGGVSALAHQLETIYNNQAKNKDAWLAKHAKANAPAASVSAGSDDEDEDEEEEEGEDSGALAREVKDLEVRLREETDKQNNLYVADQPNQSMIQIQAGIVTMVQQALLEAKKKLQESKNGSGGAKTKKAKSKPKAGGAGGRKSGGAAAQPKKAAGGGGAAAKKKKKNLTAADKDNIAGAINDLEYPHLDKAIDIIKRDTGQMESEDGELELDIDQLSHEALLKLWELCKKVLPGFGKDAAAAPSSPEINRGGSAKQSKAATAAKPKKNKPMSAQEQEARIAQLRELSSLYKPGQEPPEGGDLEQHMAPMGGNDSSDDSSEEE